ncbi:MAG: T9SS type A sorting domain-containing protein [Bacteroidota bacterium]
MFVNNIAKWDGTSWSKIVSTYYNSPSVIGITSTVSSLTLFQNKLFMAVNNSGYNGVGALALDSMYLWEWGQFNGNVNSFCIYKDTLYVCGGFTSWHSIFGGPTYPVSGIAKWNGTLWVQVGGGISVGGFSEVHSLCVHHNKLYAAGIFENAGSTYCKNIACWNDTSWSAVGNGFGFSGQFDCILLSLASYKNKLFLGGTFHQSDGYISTGLAYWNDTTFKPGGVSADLIYAMKEFNGKLYIGGWEAGQGISLNERVSCFNDTSWSATGLGPENPVYVIEVFDSSLYVGGEFLHVDSTTFVGYITRYDPTIIQDTTVIVAVKQDDSAINIYPNPATNEIKISNLSSEENQIKIFNLLGQQVKNIRGSHEQSISINISDLPSGIYMLTVSNNKKISCKKFVKE